MWHLADIPLYNGKGFWTFLAFEDGLRCRFRHYNHPFEGWKLVLEAVYFEGWCTSKQVEMVLKVKLKFRGSKSGRPTDDLLWSSGRPTAILGVRTPGRPLNLHADYRAWGLCFFYYSTRVTSWHDTVGSHTMCEVMNSRTRFLYHRRRGKVNSKTGSLHFLTSDCRELIAVYYSVPSKAIYVAKLAQHFGKLAQQIFWKFLTLGLITDIETEIPKFQYRPRKFFSRHGEQFGGIRDFAEKRCGECAMHITRAITLMCVAEVAAFLARLKTRSYRRKMQLTLALSE